MFCGKGAVMTATLDGVMTEHLSYDKHNPAGAGRGNSAMGPRPSRH